jgi:hypothetical protein
MEFVFLPQAPNQCHLGVCFPAKASDIYMSGSETDCLDLGKSGRTEEEVKGHCH